VSGEQGRVPDVSPDLPSRPWRTVLRLLERLPQASLSRSFGRLADLRLPQPMRRPVIGAFARAVGIDVDEAERPIHDYESLNDFFVRRLRPGVRTWPDDPRTVASPVDGVIGQHGAIDAGRLIQAKGRHYSAADLLDDSREAGRFDGGSFITIYLSPRHYHRIHAPCGGTVPGATHVPGALLPVNEPAVLHVNDLFPRNERLICSIDAAFGRVAVVAVGAYNVGRIAAAFDPDWAGPGGSVTNRKGAQRDQRTYSPPLDIRQGDEIMAFHLGSTIVMLTEPGVRSVAPEPGTEVKLGTVLARAR
jgi:phosphatidylserine decarboxylase